MEEAEKRGEGGGKSKLLTTGGVLSIIGGIYGVALAVMLAIFNGVPGFPEATGLAMGSIRGAQAGVTEFTFAAVAMVALLGGIDALKGRNFVFSLAGAIYSFFCTGLPAIYGILYHADLAGNPWSIVLPVVGLIGIVAILCVIARRGEFRPFKASMPPKRASPALRNATSPKWVCPREDALTAASFIESGGCPTTIPGTLISVSTADAQ